MLVAADEFKYAKSTSKELWPRENVGALRSWHRYLTVLTHLSGTAPQGVS